MKTVLVTGATGLLGGEICRYLSAKNWNVVVASQSYQKATEFCAGLCKDRTLTPIEINLLDEQSIYLAVNKMQSEGLKVNYLVNCARSTETLHVDHSGVSQHENLIKEMDLAVFAPYRLINLLIAKSFELDSIVNLSSQYSIVAPNPNLYPDGLNSSSIGYGVAKAALNQLTRELAVRLSKHKIRVNAVAFGGFEGRENKDFTDKYSELVPSGRMLSLNEAGGPVEFLLDNCSSSINGHVLVADGGWTIV